MTDNTAQQAHDLVEDTVAKAGELADQARHAVDDTVATATAALRDIDTTAAIASAREFATDTFGKLSDAYKRNPTLVLTLGSVAVAAVTGLGALLAKRR
ncbi:MULTISPECIES: hypothetical protein [Cryobacterium]|uniref:Uncharacterized protein n=1 Tax=Cryobacterium zongtaii TaxID=1259217 RepID=A0A2S3ZAK3_9MICO|nr:MULTISPECIES: hypothetical protein [Cryobacterium]POH62561.1 hypothetical protein C3B61_17095 [Cryobacterium zongtaii]POH69986.1 hypothetical protein C3B60_02380 [Cryobacterium zongtaii]TFC42997.1 hypothetical protein E3O57_14840 [Cryobacterium sp. TMN-39-2]